MKESIVYSQDTPAAVHAVCSEKTCASCFENRGCMYEQYATAAIVFGQTGQESYQGLNIKSKN